jgi:LuxR family maltose regulon positive regulatory protein
VDAQFLVIASKLRPPQGTTSLVRRDRLAVLMDTADQAKLCLILAPAGYGKSTLMSERFHKLSDTNQIVAWVCLEHDDRDPVRFLTYCCGFKSCG